MPFKWLGGVVVAAMILGVAAIVVVANALDSRSVGALNMMNDRPWP